jgi:hypothetical protein
VKLLVIARVVELCERVENVRGLGLFVHIVPFKNERPENLPNVFTLVNPGLWFSSRP